MAAPAPRPRRVPSPPARVPGERWSGVGPVCLPPAPSPESRSPSERKGEGAGGGGGRNGAAARRSPAGTATLDLPPRGRGSPHCSPYRPWAAFPAGAPGGVASNKRPLPHPPSFSEFRLISIDWREWGSCRGKKKTVRGGCSGTPLCPSSPSRSPAPSRPSGSCAPESAAKTGRPRGQPRARRRFPGSTLPLSDTTGAVLGGVVRPEEKCDRL